MTDTNTNIIILNNDVIKILKKAVNTSESATSKVVACMIVVSVYNNGDSTCYKQAIKDSLGSEYASQRGTYTKYYGTVARECEKDDIKAGVLTAESAESAVKFVLENADLSRDKKYAQNKGKKEKSITLKDVIEFLKTATDEEKALIRTVLDANPNEIKKVNKAA